MTYSELQADILSFATRDDMSLQAPMFIRMGEAEIYRRARVLEMETDITLTFDAPEYDDALPEGFQGFRRLSVSDSPNPKARYVGPDLFADLNQMGQNDFAALLGEARLLYTIESSKVKVNQPRGSAEPITMTGVYFKRFLPLSDSNPTNALLEAHPDLFLYAGLMQLWDLADELEQVAKYTAKLDKVLGQIDDLERLRKRAPGSWEKTMPRGHVI